MNAQVIAVTMLGLGIVGCRHAAPPPAPHATSADPDPTIHAKPVAIDQLPAGLPITGTVIDAVEWRDQRGRNLLVQYEAIELRHEPGVRWSPTEFVTHVAVHFTGEVTVTARGHRELHWWCSNPDRSHRARPAEVSDVDGDGVAEVIGLLDVQCGDEVSALGWAMEDGRDLTAVSDDGRYDCGGDGRIAASVRATAFAPTVRALWGVMIGAAPDDATTPSPALLAARAAYRAEPVIPPGAPGTVEDALRWHDAAGDGALLLTRRAARITATFLRRSDATWTTIAQVAAGEDGCDADDATGFVLAATTLTDLDRDGVTEVTIGYTTGCISDVSPVDAHLLIVEGPAQHTVVGSTWVGRGDDTCAPPGPLVFTDDPIRQLLDRLVDAKKQARRMR